MATELIWVKSAKDDGRVALFEKDKLHPDGEAFVCDKPVQVAMTPLVERMLTKGYLVQVDGPEKIDPKLVYKSRDEVLAKLETLTGTKQRRNKRRKES